MVPTFVDGFCRRWPPPESDAINPGRSGKMGGIVSQTRNGCCVAAFQDSAESIRAEEDCMNDASQLATAMLAIVFTAALLVTGGLFVKNRIQHEAIYPVAVAALPR